MKFCLERYIIAFISGLPEKQIENRNTVVIELNKNRYFKAAEEMNKMTDVEYEDYIYNKVFRFQ